MEGKLGKWTVNLVSDDPYCLATLRFHAVDATLGPIGEEPFGGVLFITTTGGETIKLTCNEGFRNLRGISETTNYRG